MGKGTNIVLIGMPGAGKSTVGVVAAKMLGMDFLDCDLVIQGMYHATLEQLIAERGAEGFLRLENDVLCGIACERTLIATGGSAVYSDDAMAHLGGGGTLVYLKVEPAELEQRLGSLIERGVVMRDGSIATLASLFAEREPLYEKWADVNLETAGLSLRETAEALAQKFGRDCASGTSGLQ
ncbi:MAG: shikimate kinase [Eggerthellaceae bacterium]|nr:shikimate kinase [Eggerthellaceae bacterium]